VRLPDSRPGYFGDPFDLMEFARDTLSPTTVITHVRRAKDGGLLVRGTTAENGIVKTVLVNGRPAKATAENFAEWEIALEGGADGPITLSAHAVDDYGNVEPRPHRLLVHNGPSSALRMLNLHAEAQRPDAVRRERPDQPKAARPGSDAEAIQGTWRMISQQRGGRATARAKNMKWIIENETISLIIEREGEGAPAPKRAVGKNEGPAGKAGKPSAPQRGLLMAFRLDPSQSPKHIDIDGPGKGNSFGVYKLDGDELIVCMGVTQASPSYDKRAKNDERTRPAGIDPEAGTIIVLERVKD
jgi:uncharacterized protein (TIGR03067 family)